MVLQVVGRLAVLAPVEELFLRKGKDFKSPLLCTVDSSKSSGSSLLEQVSVAINVASTNSVSDNEALQLLLQKYQEVFREAHELPPFRSHNHVIPCCLKLSQSMSGHIGTTITRKQKLRSW